MWKRREVLKLGVLASTAVMTPRWVMAAGNTEAGKRNLAMNRATWASSAADFTSTGQIATANLPSWREWHSDKADAQWIYVDLGAVVKVRSVVLRWGANYAQAYQVQVSSDSGPSVETGLVENWRGVQQTSSGKGGVEEIALPGTEARYLRLLMSAKPRPEGYMLKSLEVYGEGGVEDTPSAVPPPDADGTLHLSGGWRLADESTIYGKSAAAISRPGFDDSRWMAATVPGTVLTSYLNAGAIPDPFYGDDNKQISEFFCHTNWWYRNELELPASYAGRRVWLNFGGINYRAYIYVNGSLAGSIDGAFLRGRFDVTKLVTPGRKSCIAVLVMPVPKPGEVMPKQLNNYDWPWEFPRNEPTFLEGDSWDWLPTIHDRNTGIWNHVTVTQTGDVTVKNPFVSTHFPEFGNLSRADLTLKLELQNHSSVAAKGELMVRLGEIEFARAVTIEGGETKHLTFDKSSVPELSMRNPKLWWPNGSGEQNLYDLAIEFRSGGKLSDAHKSRVGVREFTYERASLTEWDIAKISNNVGVTDKESQETLQFFCNGQRIFARGANWGMDEGLLRCDREGFEWRLRMEKEMNFNIIRNNAGNVDKSEFFELCDQCGLMVWEEFGMSTGCMPDDPGMWLANARDRFLRRRNHACVALWCTANEMIPKDPILTEMPLMAEELDGTRLFLHCSTQTPPTNGDGPYNTRPASFYFRDFAHGFRAEIASPTIPAVESMRRMMPHNKLWPVNEMWGLHDWWLGGGWWKANELCGTTQAAIAKYGEPKGVEDFCRKAQMVNMEVFKAIYESWNDRMWNDCTGVMIWMSNPDWPSLLWNLYDYYGDATAAYFACRKACEPVHIQWNPVTNQVKAINHGFAELKGLSAEAAIYNLDGSVVQTASAHLDCPANTAQPCMTLFEEDKAGSLSSVHFIRLALKDAAGSVLATNFYWRGKEEWKYEALEQMPQAAVTGAVSADKDGRLTVDLVNSSPGIALMVRLKLVDEATGQLLAPVLYSDNYISLVAGERASIGIDLTRVKPPHAAKLVVEGWNTPPVELAKGI
ncbi:MAG: discoidin domain-containing protein [Acidobacteriaceae bacterium]|nr:discoidin domain-containing protein [Acidobacteriaceae bacterium]